MGVQQDHGLYGPLIIEDPREPLAYDHDWTVALDDWIDGVRIGAVTATPDKVLATLRQGMGRMSGTGMRTRSPSAGTSGKGMLAATPSPSTAGTPTAVPAMSPMPGMTTPAAGGGGSADTMVPGALTRGLGYCNPAVAEISNGRLHQRGCRDITNATPAGCDQTRGTWALVQAAGICGGAGRYPRQRSFAARAR